MPCALNGRAIVAATQDQSVRTVDPREHLALTVGVNKAHSHGPCVVYCGWPHHFVTCGSYDSVMQERDF